MQSQEKEWLEKIRNDFFAIINLPKDLRTIAFFEQAISENPIVLSQIPEKELTYALCEKAIRISPSVFFHVPIKFMHANLAKLYFHVHQFPTF